MKPVGGEGLEMAADIIAGYGEGAFYPPNLANNVQAVQSAGWTTIMLSLFHPNASGDIHFNNTPVFVDGAYQGDPEWVSQLAQFTNPSSGGSPIQLIASFGGGGVGDFGNIQNIYESNGNSFSGTNLESNINAMINTFSGVVSTIDMDAEDTYDHDSFIAFCNLFISQGLTITFAPYANSPWWTTVLKTLYDADTASVLRINLQCYSGLDNQPTSPKTWAEAFESAITGFNATGFILAGVKYSDTPDQAAKKLQEIVDVGGGYLCGAFIWTIDQVFQDMDSYVQAMVSGLEGA